MLITVILLSKDNGTTTKFTDDCLKMFAKKNQSLKCNIGKVINIRYDEEANKVFGDVEIPFRAAVNGNILSSIDTPSGQKIVSEFRPISVQLFIGKPKK